MRVTGPPPKTVECCVACVCAVRGLRLERRRQNEGLDAQDVRRGRGACAAHILGSAAEITYDQYVDCLMGSLVWEESNPAEHCESIAELADLTMQQRSEALELAIGAVANFRKAAFEDGEVNGREMAQWEGEEQQERYQELEY